ncbi:GNAT family N-acetyltransferase [Loktanella agnita]|uniref:GNAT family N-acetyltransferase n=1 Tax=Loktanella agnita TaxID=287097 RepID=UPI0039867FEC
MIPGTEADRAAIEAFLRAHVAISMFPLSNLARHGMAGGHGRAVRFWVKWQAGALTDVLMLTEGGLVFPCCPTAPWGDVRVVLSGRAIAGVLGDQRQVRPLRDALGLGNAAGLDVVEPHYHLPLADLRLPDCAGYDLVPISQAQRALATAWREAYIRETLPMPGEDPAQKALDDVTQFIAADTHRLLLQAGVPVAMTGFNARVPAAVQVGGVYTPPDLRGQGHARRAVGLHLQEARQKGAHEAILFAANAPAARAYEALGFGHIGEFAVVIYQTPQVIHV